MYSESRGAKAAPEPLALAKGVAISFVAIGLFVAVIGFEIGLDGEAFCTGSAMARLC